MADREQLRILREGIEAWNIWRKENWGVRPDLAGADLSEANLRWADLSIADLSRVDLSGSDLGEANLSQAKLGGANLSKANLIVADLSLADLLGANFSRANFSGTNLSGANLSRADFSDATVIETIFGDVDLSDVKGLESVRHEGPSTIGIDTVVRSRGRIPDAFLRGAGVPDDFIAYMGSLAGRAIEYYSCFISYSSEDQAVAERLHADLQAKGVRCWFAPHDLKIGDRFRQRIDEAIRIYDKLLLILSDHSIASDWVETEVEAALEKERLRGQTVLFPVRLDDSVSTTSTAWAATLRRTRHIGNFTCWTDHDVYMVAFDRLLRDLKAAPP